jgi:hypothetical protein
VSRHLSLLLVQDSAADARRVLDALKDENFNVIHEHEAVDPRQPCVSSMVAKLWRRSGVLAIGSDLTYGLLDFYKQTASGQGTPAARSE